MNSSLLGVVTPGNQVMPLLQNGLQLVEESYGKLERLGVATFWEGRTQCLENKGNLQVLSTFETPAHLAIAFLEQSHPDGVIGTPCPQLYANDDLALVYTGQLVNAIDIRRSLLRLGFHCESQRESELVLRLINRYFEIGMSLSEAVESSLFHLKGEFAVIALDARHQELLVTCQGHPLSIGVDQDTLYIASSTRILTALSSPLLHIRAGDAMVLHSIP